MSDLDGSGRSGVSERSGRSGVSGRSLTSSRSTRSHNTNNKHRLPPPSSSSDNNNFDGSNRSAKSSNSRRSSSSSRRRTTTNSSKLSSSFTGGKRRDKERQQQQISKKEISSSHTTTNNKQQHKMSRRLTDHSNTSRGSRNSKSSRGGMMENITPIMEVGGHDFIEEGGSSSVGSRRNAANNNNNNLNTRRLQQQQQQQQQNLGRAPPRGPLSQQQQLQQQQSQKNNSQQQQQQKRSRAVVHTCDSSGRCIFHPHIQLRKKSIMGKFGGWKDILPVCPDCERQELLQEFMIKEAHEIEVMEQFLERLDLHDMEYLNDDDDMLVEEEGEVEKESPIIIPRRLTSTGSGGGGSGGGGGLEPPRNSPDRSRPITRRRTMEKQKKEEEPSPPPSEDDYLSSSSSSSSSAAIPQHQQQEEQQPPTSQRQIKKNSKSWKKKGKTATKLSSQQLPPPSPPENSKNNVHSSSEQPRGGGEMIQPAQSSNRRRRRPTRDSLRLMKGVNRSFTKLKKRSKKISRSVKKQISSSPSLHRGSSGGSSSSASSSSSSSSSFRDDLLSDDDDESYSETNNDEPEGRRLSQEDKNNNNLLQRRSDPDGFHGGVRHTMSTHNAKNHHPTGIDPPTQNNSGGNISTASPFNDSSATFTDMRRDKDEILDLHASLTQLHVPGKGYDNLRMSLTEGDIEDLHASLTELANDVAYDKPVLKKASSAGPPASASNHREFNDSSATFTDNSRDRGDIADLHPSFSQLRGPSNLLQQIDSDNSSGTYTDDERDLDELQSLHASFTQLGPIVGLDDDDASSVDDNASFTDICLNMLRKPDSGAAELDENDEDKDELDDDASFTDICINMLRKSDSDAKQQKRGRSWAKKRKALSVDASDEDYDMAFDSDKFSHQTGTMQVPPKAQAKNAARLRAERWEQARKVFGAKIAEEERMAKDKLEHPNHAHFELQRRVSFSELPEEFRPKLTQPPEEITEEERTRLRAEQWKQARELFSEQIAKEERIAQEKLERQLQEKAEGLYVPLSNRNVSFGPKLEEISSSADQQTSAELKPEASPTNTQSGEDTTEDTFDNSEEEDELSEEVDKRNVSASSTTQNGRLDSDQTDMTEFSTSLATLNGTLEEEEERQRSIGATEKDQGHDSTKEETKTFDVTNLPFTGSFGESGMYTGMVNKQYQPTGKGTMMYDNGEVLKGYWKNGDFLRESELYSDSEDDDDDQEEEDEDDLNASMADVGAKKRDRSRSRSRSKDKHVKKSPPRPSYMIGDTGKKSDMVTDKDAAIAIIEKLTFNDGAFIRRSDGNWTYAEVKSFEETPEGRASIRFMVNKKNSSKSYAKKYWKSHIRPLKNPPKKSSESTGRTGRGRGAIENVNSSSIDDANRGTSCPPVQSRLSFDWPNRRGRSRSRSLHRAVSASPMRSLHSICEIGKEEEASEDETEISGQSNM
ncbi:hypothetical protein ACHAWC_011703 [Mediolabrus comicus]